MAVKNSDTAIPDLFGMPGSQFYFTGLAGSEGSRPPAPDNEPGAEITPPSGTWQARVTTDTSGTIMDGQLNEGLSGLDASFTAHSGAGDGTYSRIRRFDWQHQKGAL